MAKRRTVKNLPASFLSEFFDDVREVAGPWAVTALISRFGGTRVYIPRNSRTGSGALVETLGGPENASRIIEALGKKGRTGFKIDMPLGRKGSLHKKNIEIQDLLIQGNLTVAAIALQMDVTERGVYKIKAALREAGVIPKSRCRREKPPESEA